MKTKLLSITLIGLFAVSILSLPSCQKDAIKSSDNSSQNTTPGDKAAKIKVATFDDSQYDQLVAANEARLALLGDQSTLGLKKSISVPADYATIQEAVDAASEGANIFVNAGTYAEDVVISTAGLKLQAREGVLLIGSFRLVEGADNVTIKKFSIQMTEFSGAAIIGFAVTGGQVVQNTITADPVYFAFEQNGIAMVSCNGTTIRDNTVTGPDWAIVVLSRTDFGDGTCNNNTISNNTMSGNFVVGVQLQGNCMNNTIMNNSVSEGSVDANGGIIIFGIPEYFGNPITQGDCINNIVKNNNCTQGFAGIGVVFSAYNNTIGPNNTTNENYSYGILLYSGASDNYVFNNTALNNGQCDIATVDDGVPCLNNTFSNNTYDCFTQL